MATDVRSAMISLWHDPEQGSAIMSRTPIIGALAGDPGALIRNSGSGLTTVPGSAVELAEAILKAAGERQAWCDHGCRYYIDHLSQESDARALTDLVHSAAAGGT